MNTVKNSMRYLIIIAILAFSCEDTTDSIPNNETVYGSYARMLNINNHLYIANGTTLECYSQQSSGELKFNKELELQIEIESIKHAAGHLFIGSPQEMIIVDVTIPSDPKIRSRTDYQLNGINPCDPIEIRDQYAYVTLSTDLGRCFWWSLDFNALRVYNIKDLDEVEFVHEIEMDNPKGLGAYDDLLFVCDEGIKVFDISNRTLPEQIGYIDFYGAYDVIVLDQRVMAIGGDRLVQYSYNYLGDSLEIVELSEMEL